MVDHSRNPLRRCGKDDDVEDWSSSLLQCRPENNKPDNKIKRTYPSILFVYIAQASHVAREHNTVQFNELQAYKLASLLDILNVV